MKKILSIIALFILSFADGQNLTPSNTYVRTCLKDIECAAINSSSYLIYDQADQKFYIKIDFNAMKTGQDSVDYWLNDLTDTYFYFKAELPQEKLVSLNTYNAKTLRLDGQSFLNGIWHAQVIDVSFIKTEDNLHNNASSGGKYDAYKVNFNFSFSPKDFNIHKKPMRLTNTIFIGVSGGQINLLKSGMEGIVGEAYGHQ